MLSQEEAEVTCPICQDVFREPRTIPCGHAFCRRCLTGHVTAKTQRRAQLTFTCPLCNAPVTPPDASQDRFFWAGQFPPSLDLEVAVARMAELRDGRQSQTRSLCCRTHAAASAEAWCVAHDVAACADCVQTAHASCGGSVLPLGPASDARRQEVKQMRAHLDAIAADLQSDLQLSDVLEACLAASRREALAELAALHDTLQQRLGARFRELRARAEELHDTEGERMRGRRGALTAMAADVEETALVAEVLCTQKRDTEILLQFAALKQQYDNLLYIQPALEPPQAIRLQARGAEVCLSAMSSLVMELAQQAPRFTSPSSRRAPGSGTTSASTNVTAASQRSDRDGPDAAAAAHDACSATRDRRVQTLHKIRQKRQRVSGVTFGTDASGKPHGGAAKSSSRRVRRLWAGLDTDRDMYGLSDLCVMQPRDVIVVAYLNSPVLRLFFPSACTPAATGHDNVSPTGKNAATSAVKNAGASDVKNAGASDVKNAGASAVKNAGTSAIKNAGTPLVRKDTSCPSVKVPGSPVINTKASTFELSHSLCCLTQLEDDWLAVTSSCSSLLFLVRVNSTSVRSARSLDMRRHYRALARAGERTLALATYSSDGTTSSGCGCVGDDNVIDIVRLDDDLRAFVVLRTIAASVSPAPPGGSVACLFRAPHSLWVQPNGDVLLSDSDTPAVLGVSQGGVVTFCYRPDDPSLLDSPAGIVGTSSGRLLIVDACTHSVLRLSDVGRCVTQVLGPGDGLQWPVAIAVDSKGFIYVADFYGDVDAFAVESRD